MGNNSFRDSNHEGSFEWLFTDIVVKNNKMNEWNEWKKQGVEVTATVWTPWCGKLIEYCNVFIATQWYCHWKTSKDGDMLVGFRCRCTIRVALRPDAVQGRSRRPAKWNWKRFFRRIDRIRLYKKRRHDNTRETTPKCLLSDLPSISNACVEEKKRPKFLSFCSLGAGKQKKKVKWREWKGWKAAAASLGCSRTRCLWNLSSLQHAEGNPLIFQQKGERQRTTTTMNRSSSSSLSWSAEKNMTRRQTSSKKTSKNGLAGRLEAQTQHWREDRAVVVVVVVEWVLHSTVNFKDMMQTNWVQKHPIGDWTSRQLDQIDAEAFHSKTSPGNLEESRQWSRRKTKRKLLREKKNDSDFCEVRRCHDNFLIK